MKSVFDNFSSVTGWTASAGATVLTANAVSEYIAGLGNTASLLFKFDALNSYVEKTYSPTKSTTGYTDVVIWVWSQQKRSNEYRNLDDFAYKISFGTGKDFYMPCYESFGCFTISVAQIGSTIDKIRITALHSDTDYIVISYGVLTNDDLPLDIFDGVKERIEYEITTGGFNTLYPIGTIASLTAGASSITFASGVPWIDRYVSIMIKDGVNTEYHQISERNNLTFKFGTIHDGATLKYSYSTGASVYVYIPVVYGRRQYEIQVPSITIWGIEPEHDQLGHELEKVTESFKVGGSIQERQEGAFYKYSLLVDCEARQDQLLSTITNIVRRAIGKKYCYVIGRKVDIKFGGPPREVEPTEGFKIIPKVQYFVDVTVKEEMYTRQSLPTTDEADVTVVIE